MKFDKVRQSSLILGSGPGALSVLKDGMTVLIPGVDAWYVTGREPRTQKIPDEVQVNDPLLQSNLGVDFFVLPPAEGISEEVHTDRIDVTMFPTWLTCHTCKTLERTTEPQIPYCRNCLPAKKRRMVQTNFVVACEDGHLNEFPWVEWVHRGKENSCAHPQLQFKADGVVELRSQQVSCGCGRKRSLSGTSTGDPSGETELTRRLQEGKLFLCQGAMPWLRVDASDCTKHVRMVLRSSSNIYFAKTVSSILVPSEAGSLTVADELVESSNRRGMYLATLVKEKFDYEKVATAVLMFESAHYQGVATSEVAAALRRSFPQAGSPIDKSIPEESHFDRSPEWKALSAVREHRDLSVRSVGPFNGKKIGVENIHAVPVLRKTTALKGFSRLVPKELALAKGKQLLRRNPFSHGANWLPAIQQTGEGIFITLDPERLGRWESEVATQNRAERVQKNLAINNREIDGVSPSARFLLLHTIAHILIQELVIECGYTSASLAERIYAEGDQRGLLIYTASSTADGTMGGLVEMAAPEVLLNSIRNAIEKARWCSSDPVCMERGRDGQGNFGSNLAACHNCCLLPETACEYFNQGLDRGMLIGDTTSKSLLKGFFDAPYS